MKKCFFLLLILMSTFSYSQTPNFNLSFSKDCRYITEDGKDYIIIEYPNKSAHEIYEALNSNIVKLFNDAKDVTNGVEDKTLSIRAYTDNLIQFRWWKEPKKFTVGKALLTYVTVGANLVVDAVKAGNLHNGYYTLSGYYKINIDIKEGKARFNMPMVDGVSLVKYQDGSTVDSFPFEAAVEINRDPAVSTRKGTKEKADDANEAKKLFLDQALERMKNVIIAIGKIDNEDDW